MAHKFSCSVSLIEDEPHDTKGPWCDIETVIDHRNCGAFAVWRIRRFRFCTAHVGLALARAAGIA